MPEALVFHSAVDARDKWEAALRAEMPDIDIRASPDIGDPADVRYALVWRPPANFFVPFKNLALITNLGAGVDGLLIRDDLPNVPITRISDPNMSRMMASFVTFAVLRHARDIPTFERAQRQRRWHYVQPRTADEIRVGVLGLGELGGLAAGELARQGFQVSGWSRSARQIPGVACVAGIEALPGFLAGCEILVVMLPLTRETRHLLDADRLAMLPAGAKLINVARGPIIDEPALIAALQSGHLAEATLDVFEHEPLPPESPLWDMDTVLITPHLASIAIPRSAAAQIAANVRRIQAGEPVLQTVDPARGY
ncbi:2-hydroxyacid dehydrogenase [Aquabacter spiritensis]|uniref:Glyoxylate/hydroxypyruvate reductase A n=1 Tax=Aquabacter spiritensis TaxID=933073 RepID=A0A4R3LK08_9HYPH|nr:glyoxylate/hydroxypyruvate reductase A [Aquabacter spiritensis]TCT00612.1 glyoxylate/hydroxypyruvate reductase A [Aquabacter spiritensis]